MAQAENDQAAQLELEIGKKDALLVTDIQNDFLAGGSLAVAYGEDVIPPLKAILHRAGSRFGRIFFSRDWHPPNHCSFQSRGGPWPPHCIQGTSGAEFSAELPIPRRAELIYKATDPNHEAYSVFEGTDFDKKLRSAAIDRLFIGGLTTEYCILNTVLDARALGYDVYVFEDAIRGISADQEVPARRRMTEAGAHRIFSKSVRASAPASRRAG